MAGIIRHTGIQNQAFVFRQWSRAGYAIFNSLKRVVNIGNLDIAISSVLGSKATSYSIHKDFTNNQILEDSESEDSSLLSEALIQETLSLLTPQKTVGASPVGRKASCLVLLANSILLLVNSYIISSSTIDKSFHFNNLRLRIGDCESWFLNLGS